MPANKQVYLFGSGMTDGGAELLELLGGKGANLAEMAVLGLPVPPGFTITTEVCNAYYANGRRLPEGLRGAVEAALGQVGKSAGRRFGNAENPLLVSVRSGSRASMPGMMDTILDLGLNDQTVAGLARHAGDERQAALGGIGDARERVDRRHLDGQLGATDAGDIGRSAAQARRGQRRDL